MSDILSQESLDAIDLIVDKKNNLKTTTTPYLQYHDIVNKYPFLELSPLLAQSQIYLTANVPHEFYFPKLTHLARFISNNDVYYGLFNAPQAPTTGPDMTGNASMYLPAKTLSPLYFVRDINNITFLSTVNATMFIEHGN